MNGQIGSIRQRVATVLLTGVWLTATLEGCSVPLTASRVVKATPDEIWVALSGVLREESMTITNRGSEQGVLELQFVRRHVLLPSRQTTHDVTGVRAFGRDVTWPNGPRVVAAGKVRISPIGPTHSRLEVVLDTSGHSLALRKTSHAEAPETEFIERVLQKLGSTSSRRGRQAVESVK